jgi:hypothetical protein
MNLFDVVGFGAKVAGAFDLFGIKRTTSIDGFLAFVCTDESHSDGMEVTTHAVQQGFVVTDHILRKPSTLSLNVIVEGDFFGLSIDDKYTQALEFMRLGEVVDVVTTTRFYTNMIITSIDSVTDTKSEKLLSMRIELVEIRIVNAEVVEVPPEEKQSNPKKTGSTKKTGNKTTKSGSGATGSKSGAGKAVDKKKTEDLSVLYKLIGG